MDRGYLRRFTISSRVDYRGGSEGAGLAPWLGYLIGWLAVSSFILPIQSISIVLTFKFIPFFLLNNGLSFVKTRQKIRTLSK